MAPETKEQRDVRSANNTEVVSNFSSHWSGNGIELRDDNRAGLNFRAQVTYKTKQKSVVQQADITIFLSGFNDEGRIEIHAEGKLNVKDFHLGISPSYGDYQLNQQTGELVYNGYSPNKGGDYEVRLLPLV